MFSSSTSFASDSISPNTEPLTFSPIASVKGEISKVIIGQDHLLDRLLIALLVQGHVLLEGVPGLAKTKTLMCLSNAISGKMDRVQFTPDLLPSDIIGTEVYRPQTGEFVLRKGPVFTNLLLADEINRAPAKVQSALLEAMAEHHVSIAGVRHQLPKPFMVLATQNPIEQSGTYELPEAQLDRFLMKLRVGYPSFDEELKILSLHAGMPGEGIGKESVVTPVLTPTELLKVSEEVSMLYVDQRIDTYIVRLVHATRNPSEFGLKSTITWGASPRASLALKQCARALAYLKGRKFVTPDDIKELAPDILRHRILLSFDAIGDGLTTDSVITSLLAKIPTP
jgi:MoxR-like ATPase